jgi:hypothetical protein
LASVRDAFRGWVRTVHLLLARWSLNGVGLVLRLLIRGFVGYVSCVLVSVLLSISEATPSPIPSSGSAGPRIDASVEVAPSRARGSAAAASTGVAHDCDLQP